MARQAEIDDFFVGKAEKEELKLAKLPEGWKWVKLKDVVQRFKSGFACAKVNAVKKGMPHLRPNNIGYFGKLDFSQLVFLPPKLVDLEKYSLKKGDVLFNNTNSKELVGRASLVKEDLEYGFSNHITRVRVKEQLITPAWFMNVINNLWFEGHFLRICRKWIGQAGVNTKMLKSVMIPLPPLKEQERIGAKIAELSSKIEEAERIRKESRKNTERTMQAALHHIFSKAEKRGWEYNRLDGFCKINPSRIEIRDFSDDLEVTFVPMKAVNEMTGRIEEPERRSLGEVRKGYTYFKEGDVLFAKITPCMENGKSAIARNLINKIGFGSTEFHVIRPLRDTMPEWIYFFVRQKSFRKIAARNMTGTVGHQRVPKGFIEETKIPLPPLEEQKELISYFSNLKEKSQILRQKHNETDIMLERITPAILDKAFKGKLV